ncbi:lysylphosphatidylglycerol synthase transmembrane domain-containing protein [Alloalcanivorax mobilis]|uniref:lysylphosphatidylglycerol synthase transmembrane domain-containing protein n=1 Tax=Alloalcanivorax mobilis TaxID=2019569 RepID=UPI000B5B174C|nr:lysylphosphatidylglycerol synthase transmembrane domain-containing protein [Alloalcanivorax mobilis]ASK33973.1 TIGR00374 family protein [Alcanivorax sp. N3-2A]|tara:strand:+ start:32125 stop:33132 length:1008 start_codon:yes stop_codon:yes gene_type:complete
MKRHWVVLLFVAVLVGASVPLILGGKGLFIELLKVPPSWLLGMVALIFLCWNLNALRLRLMLKGRARHLSHRAALATVMATEFTLNATPGGSGAPFAMAALLRRHGVAPATATAVLAVDQLTDLLVFLLLLPTLALYGLSRYLNLDGWWELAVPFALLSAGLLLVVLMARAHRPLLSTTGEWLRRLRVKRSRRFGLARSMLRFRSGIGDTLAVPKRRLLAMFGLCLAHWLLRYSVIWLAVLSLGDQIDWVYGFFVQMVAMGAGHLTLLPGGAGGAEVAGAAMLNPWLGSLTTATVIVVWRFITFYWYLIAGGLVMLIFTAREARRARAASPPLGG